MKYLKLPQSQKISYAQIGLIMDKVILKGHIIVPDSDLTAVKAELSTHIKLTREENGCLVFNVSQDESNEFRFNVYEEFVDKQSFSSHQDRVRNSNWGNITTNVERHYEIIGVE